MRMRFRHRTLLASIAVAALALSLVAARRRWDANRALAAIHERRADEWRFLASGWDGYASRVEILAVRLACGEPFDGSDEIDFSHPESGRKKLAINPGDSAARLAEVAAEARDAAASCRREADRQESEGRRLVTLW